MVQDNRNLPEGTDSIIPGAMETDTSGVTGTGQNRGSGGQGSSGQSASSGQSGSDSSGGSVIQKIRSSGDKLSGEAAGKARDFVGQGLERSSDALSNVSKLIGDTAEGLDETLGPEYADYARRAAEAIDRTAESLRNKNPDELIDDTRDFVRKSPGVALAGAAIVGFALARIVKSGLSGTDRQDSDGGNTGQRT